MNNEAATDVTKLNEARIPRACLSWGLAALVLGMRLSVFRFAGSALPYYDQWIGEFNNIFLLGINGESWWSILLTPHNEHLLFTTKALSLIGFAMNGYWDVKFLVVAAAMVRAAEAAFAFRILSAGSKSTGTAIVWSACALIYVMPLSGYNLLNGMQVSFFFVHIAAFWTVRTVGQWQNPRSSAFQLIGSCIVGLLSMGGAVALPVVSLAVALLQRRRLAGFWPVWTLTVALTAAYALNYVTNTSKDRPLAWSQLDFFLRLFSWPFFNAWVGAGLVILVAIGFYKIGRVIKLGPGAIAGAGIIVFGGINAILVALNRSMADFHMRHWDEVSLLILGLATFGLAAVARDNARFRRAGLWMVASFLVLSGLFLVLRIREKTWPYLKSGRENREIVIHLYRDRLISGGILNESFRINGMLMNRDYSFFDDPVDRFALHPTVAENVMRNHLQALALLSPEIIPSRPSSVTSLITNWTIQNGWIFFISGAALTVTGMNTLRVRKMNRAIPTAKMR